MVNRRLKNPSMCRRRGEESQISSVLQGKSETRHLVSYVFNRLLSILWFFTAREEVKAALSRRSPKPCGIAMLPENCAGFWSAERQFRFLW